MKNNITVIFTVFLLGLVSSKPVHAQAQAGGRTQTIEERTAGMLDGYFPLY